jgi:hypothetical protein
MTAEREQPQVTPDGALGPGGGGQTIAGENAAESLSVGEGLGQLNTGSRDPLTDPEAEGQPQPSDALGE